MINGYVNFETIIPIETKAYLLIKGKININKKSSYYSIVINDGTNV